MKIILIGNYSLDNQESMRRFADMLNEGFKIKGIEVEIWKPIAFFGKIFSVTNSGLGKWLGYVDKYLLFPIILKLRLNKRKYANKNLRFHICDHSNAPYLKYLPKDRSSITCHDVLAIRGSMGYKDAYAPASKMGVVLQRWIFSNLEKAKTLAAVSNFTLNQLKEISVQPYNKKNWRVIYNAFNAPFVRMEANQSIPLLQKMGININDPFLLHVGSSELRKNRKLLLHMVHNLKGKWHGKICFAGKPLEEDMLELAESLSLTDRIISIVGPSHEELRALYSTCEAFIFPSFSEGFGWPIIEAQACGAPIIASSFEPMREVSGGNCLYAHPEDAEGFANAFLSLQNNTMKEKMISLGYVNAERFNMNKMMDAYLSLYETKGSRIFFQN